MIGVLALQGGFAAHEACLQRLDLAHCQVRLAKDLQGLHALILPGGESTTILKLMEAFELAKPLRDIALSGIPILGTCAGAILMCRDIHNHDQSSLGLIPAAIDRNAYGSQRESFSQTVDCPLLGLHDLPALFIRAPRFVSLGKGVQVLSRHDDHITGLVYNRLTAVTYHPELGNDDRFHEAWYSHFVAPFKARVTHV